MLREKIKKVIRTAGMKVLHPSVRTAGWLMVRLNTEIIVRNGGALVLGANVSTFPRVTLAAAGGRLTVGSGVSFNRGDILVSYQEITIGDGCAFGPNVIVYDHDHVFSAQGFEMDQFKTAPVVIEEGCWIGANVTILRGTHIGKGSVIGAGAVVKGNIPPHSLVKSDRTLIIEPIREGK